MNKFEHKYFIHYYDIDKNRKATITSLMRYFEDIAILHSESRGLGLDYYDENNVGWFLYKWDIQISEYPNFADTITLITEPKAYKGFYANREYTILGDDKMLGKINTLWIFMDTAKMRPKKINTEMHDNFWLDSNADGINKLDDLETLNTPLVVKQFDVRQSDIDTNNHVNNRVYIDWALETVPIEIKETGTLKSLKVTYMKQLSYGDSIEACSEMIEENSSVKFIHSIRSNSKEYCRLQSTWKL
ncbi:MAG: acyl-ACP thioesterase [Ignavibacteriae bacterium]|nr:acyl-ACP thioesterase [Ignavibacteriota bacterium]NOG97666.1 acyl-ACP thioesterase [Ignavibacteriota bacterium]